MRPIQFDAQIISNNKISEGHYLLSLKVPFVSKDVLPGQFVHIKINDLTQPFLRRPFSIYRVKASKGEMLYKVVGIGTKILSQKKSGEHLDVIGPLGNGFSILDDRCSILVAGGMGVAPLIFLAEKLAELKTQNSKLKTIVLIGAKTKNNILREQEFKDLGCEVKVSTEDGSRGFKGKVTNLLSHLLSTIDCGLSAIYACGPKPMLAELEKICQKNKIPAQVSLEEFMGCGIGVCLGCVVKTKSGYKRVCKDGPVFGVEDIVWEF